MGDTVDGAGCVAETIRAAYSSAIAHGYLFYSYGDCMFITSRMS